MAHLMVVEIIYPGAGKEKHGISANDWEDAMQQAEALATRPVSADWLHLTFPKESWIVPLKDGGQIQVEKSDTYDKDLESILHDDDPSPFDTNQVSIKHIPSRDPRSKYYKRR